jgi:predicted DNA-binding protein (MmcQ/YjbR family)
VSGDREAPDAEAEIRAYALGFPEATEAFPWGERVIKVRGKVFVFMSSPGSETVGITVKLPISAEDVLALSFTERPGYGLGQHGWVNANFGPGEEVPVELLKSWIAESYRAVAPKRLVKLLDADAGYQMSPTVKPSG